jgi:hypothetical protein
LNWDADFNRHHNYVSTSSGKKIMLSNADEPQARCKAKIARIAELTGLAIKDQAR